MEDRKLTNSFHVGKGNRKHIPTAALIQRAICGAVYLLSLVKKLFGKKSRPRPYKTRPVTAVYTFAVPSGALIASTNKIVNKICELNIATKPSNGATAVDTKCLSAGRHAIKVRDKQK